VKVTGVSGQDEDILAFTPTTLGSTTAGTWALYFDGSDVGLTANDAEDVKGLYVQETPGLPTLYLTTVGNFSVSGVSGANEDVLAFKPTGLGSTTAGSFGPGLALDGSLYGLSAFSIDGIQFNFPTLTLTARDAALEAVDGAQPALAAILVEEPAPPKEIAETAPKIADNVGAKDKNALIAVTQKSKRSKNKSNATDCGCSSKNAESAKLGKSSKRHGHRGR
jgi:hypothetical protein